MLGCTGVETRELLSALAKEFQPAALIAVDALAARSLSRLGCTIQLSTGGISPGSGVDNARPQLSHETLGVPVVGVGVPTVVDAGTLAADLLGRAAPKDKVAPRGASMVVTPREIDLLIARAARMVAMAINTALNPSLSVEEFAILAG